MKVTGLAGDYCPTCAGVLEGHRKDPKKLIVMCGSVCHATLQQSGDYEQLNNSTPAVPAVPTPPTKQSDSAQPIETERRAGERDPGEAEQHEAERAGYVTKGA